MLVVRGMCNRRYFLNVLFMRVICVLVREMYVNEKIGKVHGNGYISYLRKRTS